ncbi:NUDIX hydrolase [Candidatus Saccharibacteria bacterium]|nr:NUDIX hydrolase [Candidatus Saccharibacteria bacterium]
MNTATDSVRIAIFKQSAPTLFLILAEADDPANFKLPGGKFDSEDELPEAAAYRELNEELGLFQEQITLMAANRLTNRDGVSARYIFACQAAEADIKPSAEIELTRWVTETDVPEGPNHDHILSAVAEARTRLTT